MKKNMGSTDRTTRTVVAVLIGILYFTKIITGTLATVLLVVAVVFALTSFISFCPAYTLLGVNTCKTKN